MKITKSQLKQIIKEEISKVLSEGPAEVPEIGMMPSSNPKDILMRIIDPDGLFAQADREEEGMEIIASHPETEKDYEEAINLIMKVQTALNDPDSGAVYTDNETGERLISVDAILDLNQDYNLSQIPVSNWVEMLPRAVPIFADLQQAVTTIYIRNYSEHPLHENKLQ